MHHNFTCNVNGRKVMARAFTYGEYQQFFTGDTKQSVLRVIEECTGIDAGNLAVGDAETLFIQLWAHSLNRNSITRTWVCECGEEQDLTLPLTKSRAESEFSFFHDLGGVVLHMREPRFNDSSNPIEMVLTCIDYLIIDGEQFKLDDLSEKDFETVLSMITQEHVQAIIDKLTENHVTLAVPVKCKCGACGVHVVKGLKEFLEVL